MPTFLYRGKRYTFLQFLIEVKAAFGDVSLSTKELRSYYEMGYRPQKSEEEK